MSQNNFSEYNLHSFIEKNRDAQSELTRCSPSELAGNAADASIILAGIYRQACMDFGCSDLYEAQFVNGHIDNRAAGDWTIYKSAEYSFAMIALNPDNSRDADTHAYKRLLLEHLLLG